MREKEELLQHKVLKVQCEYRYFEGKGTLDLHRRQLSLRPSLISLAWVYSRI